MDVTCQRPPSRQLASRPLYFFSASQRLRQPAAERDWLRGVGRMWELIKRSALLADYNRAVQKLHAYV